MMPDKELLARIEAFDIDGEARPALRFAARLADENGWSRAFAERVIVEYKRFAFLAMTAGHPVCPSDEVDEAWHMHLTYTRSYWQRFCGETLGRELHHDPTRGGDAEDDKHWRMYDATLAAYRRSFAAEPPADIWPPVEKRFSAAAVTAAPIATHVRARASALMSVNPLPILTLVAAAFAAWTYYGAPNPYTMRGTSFFWFYLPAIAVALLAMRLVYPVLRARYIKPYRRFKPLEWDEAAYVAGGTGRLSSAAMARLVAGKLIRVSNDRKQLEATGRPAGEVSPIERVVLQHMPIAKGATETPRKFTAMESEIQRHFALKARALEADGVVLSATDRSRLNTLVLLPLLVLLVAIGIPRLATGLSSGRPVAFLVISMIGALVMGFVVLSQIDKGVRTPKADEQLESLRKQNAALQTNAGTSLGTVGATAAAVGLGVALFGTSALANSDVAELSDLDVFLPTRANQSSGCGGGCGSSTSSGGGGDGGGCSGGGCGGGGGD